MAPLLPRIFLLSNLLNSFILHLVPKKFRSYLPSSWYNAAHQPAATHLSPPENPTAAKDPAAGRPPLPPPTPTYLPRVDTAELQRVFKMFDGNGDGTITMDELRSSLKNMGIAIPDHELVQMIDRVDVNGDGCVDMDEFQTLYRMITDERDEEEDIANAFNVFDKNGDGFITVEELRTVLSSLGLEQGRREEDCKRMIMKVDVDGDGMVSLMEFKQMMRDGSFVALR